jgi:hypothetical protein
MGCQSHGREKLVSWSEDKADELDAEQGDRLDDMWSAGVSEGVRWFLQLAYGASGLRNLPARCLSERTIRDHLSRIPDAFREMERQYLRDNPDALVFDFQTSDDPASVVYVSKRGRGRPSVANPSAATLRKRRQRERDKRQ